jgi:hypothetical protein
MVLFRSEYYHPVLIIGINKHGAIIISTFGFNNKSILNFSKINSRGVLIMQHNYDIGRKSKPWRSVRYFQHKTCANRNSYTTERRVNGNPIKGYLVSGYCPSSGSLKNTTFRKHYPLPSSGEGVGDDQWFRLVLSNGPNRVCAFRPPHLTMERDQVSETSYSLEYRRIDIVQQRNKPESLYIEVRALQRKYYYCISSLLVTNFPSACQYTLMLFIWIYHFRLIQVKAKALMTTIQSVCDAQLLCAVATASYPLRFL